MEQKFYGWIPILTCKIRAIDLNHDKACNFYKVFSDTNLGQKVIIKDLQWDKRGFLSSFNATLSDKCVIKTQCEIKETGLVAFSFIVEPEIENKGLLERLNKNIAINLFDFIRDMYHEHVHHDRNVDAIIAPVLASDDSKAIKEILEQFSTKVVYHHKSIKMPSHYGTIEAYQYWGKTIDMLNSAIGEYVYIKTFVCLHKNLIENSEDIIKSFQNASDSVSTLKEKYTWKLMYHISVAVLIFTTIGIIPVLWNIIKNIYFLVD